jgi:hypothetical protein
LLLRCLYRSAALWILFKTTTASNPQGSSFIPFPGPFT